MMHQVAMVRCHYISYLQAVTADFQFNTESSLQLFLGVISNFKETYGDFEQTEEDTQLEGAVLSNTVLSLDARMADYHMTFTEKEHEEKGIRGNFELSEELKFAHLETEKELKKARTEDIKRFVKSSVRTFYQRLADATLHAEAIVDEDEDEGAALADLAEFLSEDIIIQVMDRADQFTPYYAKAPHEAVKELVRCFGKDMKKMVSRYTDMDPAMQVNIAVHVKHL
jgi:hypothetical protein